jgi:PAS domain S-box-containing protein
MNLRTIFLLFIGTIQINVYAANKELDSLQNLIQNSQNPSQKIDAYLASAEGVFFQDSSLAYDYLIEGIKLSIQINDNQRLGEALIGLGNYYERSSHYKDALENYLLAEGIFERVGNKKWQANALNRIGVFYGKRNDCEPAIEKFKEVLKLRIETKDSAGIASVYMNFGNIYEQLGSTTLAKSYYAKSLEIELLIKEKKDLSSIFSNIGFAEMKIAHYDSANYYFQKALAARINEVNHPGLPRIYCHIALNYTNMESFDSASYYLNLATNQSLKNPNDEDKLYLNYCFVKYYNGLGNFAQAAELGENMLEKSIQLGLPKVESDANFELHLANEGLGNYQNALTYFKRFSILQDSLNSRIDKFNLREHEASFKWTSKLEELKKYSINSTPNGDSWWNSQWLVVLLFFIAISVLILLFEIGRNRKKNKAKEEYEHIDYLRSHRIFYLVGAVLYTLVPVLMLDEALKLHDPLSIRISVSCFILAAYIATFWVNWVRINRIWMTKIIYFLVVTHHFILIYLNSLSVEHFLFLLIVLAAIGIVFKTIKGHLLFSIYIIFCALAVIYFVEFPIIDSRLFVGVIVAILLISFVISLSNMDLDEQLEYSNNVVHEADALVFIVDRKGENIYTSHSVLNILGYEPYEFRTHNWIEVMGIEPETARKIKNNLIAIAIGIVEPNLNPYQRIQSKDGQIKWLSIKEKRLKDDRVLVIGMDVTDQKATQDQLSRSEGNFRQIAENISDVFYLYDLVKKKFEYVSPNVIDITGNSSDWFYGQNQLIYDFVVDEDKENVQSNVVKLSEGNAYDIVYRIFVNRKIRWIREKGFPIVDQEGKVVKQTGLCQDISEQKEAEEEIKKLSLVASYTDNFILMVGADNRIEWANQAFYKLTGYSELETIGNLPLSLISGSLSSETVIDQITKAVFVDKKQLQCEMINYKKDENIFYSQLEVTPLLNRVGELEKYFVIGSDITEKKNQELKIQKIADRLEVIHSIEKTILTSESSEDIIYNTLNQALNKMPISRSSLTMFNLVEKTFYVYARVLGEQDSITDRREYNLSEFSMYETLLNSKSDILVNLSKKEVLSPTDKILVEEGVTFLLLSPLVVGDRLIGSFNVCFNDGFQEDVDYFRKVTKEVANGLAIALQQSQLTEDLFLSNQALTSSIDYAKMIQQAYIPSDLSLKDQLLEHFIINRPKDIVSGDFYWIGEYNEFQIIAVGDCTGHGVPSAFMTIIGISELNNIVRHKGITDPGQILIELNLAIVAALASTNEIQLKDGMDVGIFVFNRKTEEVVFAGARRPLYHFTQGELKQYDGTKLSIGDFGEQFGIRYKSTVISAEKGDIFYLFSDGCTDQFGGDRIRKYSRKQLETNLIDNSHLPLIQQKEIIEASLVNWQGQQTQTDDILLVGFKIK